MPVAVGALHRHEVTGEPIFRLLAANFLEIVNSSRTLATGGSTHHENWGAPNALGHTLGPPPLGTVHQESCVTHNTLRLALDLFRHTRQPRYAEFAERLQLNGVLGTQRGTQPGQMLYFYPLGTGVKKSAAGIQLGTNGWSHPTEYFSCCMGTGIEAHARLQEAVFFHSASAAASSAAASSAAASSSASSAATATAAAAAAPTSAASTSAASAASTASTTTSTSTAFSDELWLVSFISSELRWPEQHLVATLRVQGPGDVPAGQACSATLTLQRKLNHAPSHVTPGPVAPAARRLHVRVPRWARNAAAAAVATQRRGSGDSDNDSGGGDGGLRVFLRDEEEAGGNEGGRAEEEEQRVRVDPNADFWSFAFSQRALSARRRVTLRFELPVALHVEPLKVKGGGGG